METERKNLAIACQGGGSHTAFTAGVLDTFLRAGVQKQYRLVGLSGTSGGGICAALAWWALVNPDPPTEGDPFRGILDFWKDNSAQLPWESMLNAGGMQMLRMQEQGWLPTVASSPYHWGGVISWMKLLAPRPQFVDLAVLIERHLPFQRIREVAPPTTPRLFLGAVDVLSGAFKVFDSFKREITVKTLEASAAIPSLFPAVTLTNGEGRGVYWDGLFSENPPVDCFTDLDTIAPEDRPDEIWVIRINPKERRKPPVSSPAIQDRLNELSGNLSLASEEEDIGYINRLLEKNAFSPEFLAVRNYRPITVREVTMSPEVVNRLDYTSKLNRDPAFLELLIADGKKQGRAFLGAPVAAPPVKHMGQPRSGNGSTGTAHDAIPDGRDAAKTAAAAVPAR